MYRSSISLCSLILCIILCSGQSFLFHVSSIARSIDGACQRAATQSDTTHRHRPNLQKLPLWQQQDDEESTEKDDNNQELNKDDDDDDNVGQDTIRVRIWRALASGKELTLKELGAVAGERRQGELRAHLQHVEKQAQTVRNKSAKWRERRGLDSKVEKCKLLTRTKKNITFVRLK